MTRALLAMALAGCASAPPPAPVPLPSLLPPPVALDAILAKPAPSAPLPPSPRETASMVAPPRIRDDMPVDEGNPCGLPPGVLVDDNVYAAAIATRSERDRLLTENRALRSLRASELAAISGAEAAYRAHITALESDLSNARSPWRSWAWFALGVATASLGALAGSRATR